MPVPFGRILTWRKSERHRRPQRTFMNAHEEHGRSMRIGPAPWSSMALALPAKSLHCQWQLNSSWRGSRGGYKARRDHNWCYRLPRHLDFSGVWNDEIVTGRAWSSAYGAARPVRGRPP